MSSWVDMKQNLRILRLDSVVASRSSEWWWTNLDSLGDCYTVPVPMKEFELNHVFISTACHCIITNQFHNKYAVNWTALIRHGYMGLPAATRVAGSYGTTIWLQHTLNKSDTMWLHDESDRDMTTSVTPYRLKKLIWYQWGFTYNSSVALFCYGCKVGLEGIKYQICISLRVSF